MGLIGSSAHSGVFCFVLNHVVLKSLVTVDLRRVTGCMVPMLQFIPWSKGRYRIVVVNQSPVVHATTRRAYAG